MWPVVFHGGKPFKFTYILDKTQTGNEGNFKVRDDYPNITISPLQNARKPRAYDSKDVLMHTIPKMLDQLLSYLKKHKCG
jgi:hypothetical protein